ncbi:hypothetical protein CDD83_5389 [Cordyceps sp. RAO-2017]|nr:hypothetical protein CDD83_5389 [Cordyceps sp. RAO-2017]
MFIKNIVAVAATAALAEQALALNSHRHLHRRRPQDNPAPIIQTIYETVTADGNPVETPSPQVYADIAPPPPQPQPTTMATYAKPGDAPPTASTPASPDSGDVCGGNPFTQPIGLAYDDVNLVNTFPELAKVGWASNWNSDPGNLNPSIQFVPTLRNDPDCLKRWEGDLAKAVERGSKAAQSLNEPDISSQANMTPRQAAEFHVKYMNRAGEMGLKVSAPSVSNSEKPNQGLDYLRQWVEVCKELKCTYHFCTVHWYSPLKYKETLYDHISQAQKICGKPVVLGEFGLVDDAGQHIDSKSLLEEAIPKFKGNSCLWGYAPFYCAVGGNQGRLLDSPAKLSDTGKALVSS